METGAARKGPDSDSLDAGSVSRVISDGRSVMGLDVPEPLKREHEKLHEELRRVTQAGGRTGEVARAVAALLHPHFLKEEEYALPPLGLLAPLARGEDVPQTAEALAMTERLRAELSHMLAEHSRIRTALDVLTAAAEEEGRPEHAHFAEQLALHAQTEEEVLYPAAILVGEYLRLRHPPDGQP
jgi:hypothetical protein